MDRKEKIVYWLLVPLLAASLPVFFGWQTVARLSGWAPVAECPGSPVVISIISPGDAVRVPSRDQGGKHELYDTTFVVEASRPVSEDYDWGLVTKGSKDSQYRLRFWWQEERVSPTKVRKGYVNIALEDTASKSVQVWAVLVDSKKSFGEYYSDLSQVTSNKSLIAISKPITIAFAN
jgi:hypothetical protein